jgi:hypothetical protein
MRVRGKGCRARSRETVNGPAADDPSSQFTDNKDTDGDDRNRGQDCA